MAKHALPLWKRDTPRRALVLAVGAATALPLVAVPALAGKPGSGSPQGFSVSDGTVQEASAGTTTATFTISLSEPPRKSATVQYVTTDGTAVAPDDFTAFGGTLTFAARETSKTLTVPVRGDTLDEVDETFSLMLSAPSGAAIVDGTGAMTILDDDAAPTVAVSDAQALEGDSGLSPLTFNVRLSRPSGREVSVLATTVDGSAIAGVDYDDAGSTLVFPPGEILQTVVVNARPDDLDEADETFRVLLQDAVGATIADASGLGRILDDDAPATPTIESTDPASPAASTSPKVRGFAPEGTTVKIAAGGCGGAVIGQAPAFTFATTGVPVTVGANTTTQLFATATSSTGKTSPCSAAFPYTTDTIPPAAPTGLVVTPAGPSNIDTPTVRGSAEAGSLVDVFTSSGCSGLAAASGTAAELAAGLLTPVPLNATSIFSARARDAVGNASSCAAGPSYTHDGIAPDAPVVTGSVPPSPSDDETPSLTGVAQPGTTVRVYSSGDCTGSPVATVAATSGGSWSTPELSVAEDTTTLFSATATDPAGNQSACSQPFAYVESVDQPAGAPTFTQASPPSPYDLMGQSSVEVLFIGEAPGDAPVTIYGRPGCDPSLGQAETVVSGETWQFQLALVEGDYEFSVGLSDGSACGDSFAYTVVNSGGGGGGGGIDEIEPNDAAQDANIVGAGSTTRAQIGFPFDVDWFTFALDAPQRVTVETASDGCAALALDSEIELFDSVGTGLGFNDDINANLQSGDFCSRITRVLDVGQYFVRTSASQLYAAGQTYDYSLVVTVPSGLPESGDYDDLPQTAPFVGEQSTTLSGRLEEGDRDFYRFQLTETSDVTTRLTGAAGDCPAELFEVQLALLASQPGNPSASVLATSAGSEQPDGCPAIAPATHPGAGSLPGGSYALGIVRIEGSTGGPFDYQLALGITPAVTPPGGTAEIEPNDDSLSAMSLSLPADVSAAFNHLGDQDWYSVTVQAGEQLRLETFDQSGTACGGGIDTILTLFDSSLTQLSVSDDQAPDNRCSLIEQVSAATATYFVRANDFADDDNYLYRLKVTTTPMP